MLIETLMEDIQPIVLMETELEKHDKADEHSYSGIFCLSKTNAVSCLSPDNLDGINSNSCCEKVELDYLFKRKWL